MRLYSIRHKHSGKFFTSTDGIGTEYWATSPHFWKTIDGVAVNLRRLASEFWKEPKEYGNGFTWTKKAWRHFDPEKLADIEVIVTDVAVLGETRLKAIDLLEQADGPLETAGH